MVQPGGESFPQVPKAGMIVRRGRVVDVGGQSRDRRP